MAAAARPDVDGACSPEDSVSRRDLLDPHTRFFYMPHTVTALLVGTVLYGRGACERKVPKPARPGAPC